MAPPFLQEIYKLYKDAWFPTAPPTAIQQFYNTYTNHYVLAKKPKNLLKCAVKLAEETGEVAEAVSAFCGNEKKTKKLALDNNSPEEALTEELADVIIVALNIAYAAKLDPDKMFLKAAAKMKARADKRIADKILADRKRVQQEVLDLLAAGKSEAAMSMASDGDAFSACMKPLQTGPPKTPLETNRKTEDSRPK